jgi:hypothetical protein
LRGDRLLLSSRLLFTCSAVGEVGTYPGSTVVKELFENTRPPEDRTGDAVLALVGVDGWSELGIEDSASGEKGKSCRISRYPCWINPKNRTSRVYILSRTSPKVAGINDDISPGSALEHSGVQAQPNASGKRENAYLGFSLGIEPNLINGIAVSHAIVKHRFINDYVSGGQLLKGNLFFVIFGLMGLGSRYDRLRVEESTEVTLSSPT